jgi:hypothetical protein
LLARKTRSLPSKLYFSNTDSMLNIAYVDF